MLNTQSCGLRHLLRSILGEFPDGPKVRTWHFHCWGLSSIPCQGTKIPQVSRHSQKNKKTKPKRQKKKKSILPGTSKRSQTCWYGHHQNKKKEKSKQKGGKEVWIILCEANVITTTLRKLYLNYTLSWKILDTRRAILCKSHASILHKRGQAGFSLRSKETEI